MFRNSSNFFANVFVSFLSVFILAGCSYFDTGLVAKSSDLDLQVVEPVYDIPDLPEVFYRSTDGRVQIYDLDEPVPQSISYDAVPAPASVHREPIQTLQPQVPDSGTPLLDLATSPFATPEQQDFTAQPVEANDSNVEIFTLD